MSRIDLENIGGFPLEQDTLHFMQEGSADMFASLANMLGNKAILSGVEVMNGNVTDGWITYQGEIIKFVGAAAGPDVVIIETEQSVQFEDGTLRPVYKTRHATIGAPGDFPFSDLKSPNVGVPTGTVLMWSGAVNAIPRGFALCNGANGTPNLSGKFIAGYDAADVDYNAIGKTGGEKRHTLSPNEQGDIEMRLRADDGDDSQAAYKSVTAMEINGSSISVSAQASNSWSAPLAIPLRNNAQPHENRPPYYTLAYIIKL